MALIGSAEARRAGFVTEDGKCLELEKTVDEKAKTLTIRLAVKKQDED